MPQPSVHCDVDLKLDYHKVEVRVISALKQWRLLMVSMGHGHLRLMLGAWRAVLSARCPQQYPLSAWLALLGHGHLALSVLEVPADDQRQHLPVCMPLPQNGGRGCCMVCHALRFIWWRRSWHNDCYASDQADEVHQRYAFRNRHSARRCRHSHNIMLSLVVSGVSGTALATGSHAFERRLS